VFGVVRPVLLWSRSLGLRLSDREVDAILAHEVSHVRRRDNLMAVIQMAVEAVFWFHPLVWWVERRLVDERERACDDEVLRRGRAPHVYAESLLKICEWCVESPLTCVAGVTGSDLNVRIEAIMKNRRPAALSAGRAVLVSVAASLAIAIPVFVGLSSASPLRAQGLQPAVAGGTPAFDVASIKRNPDIGGPRLFPLPAGGRVRLTNQTLRTLINSAYRIQDYQIIGGPEWARTQGFDIEAIVEATPAPSPPQMLLRIQTLLADRFKLVMHAETRELPVYKLVKSRSGGQLGPNIRPTACKPPEPSAAGGGGPAVGGPSVCGNWGGAGLMMVGGNTMNGLANQLGRLAPIGRPVINETNLTGGFDWELKWTPDPAPGSSAPADAVSIFTALQEQLGVKLEAARGPVDVLVIDSVQLPSDNQGSPSGAITTPRSFEVASVKPNKSGDVRVSGGFQQGGRYRVTNYTLRALIAAAYVRPQVNPDFLISGGPKWIDSDHFDVEAKATEDLPAATGAETAASPRRVMLQSLLAERFKLKVHVEASERPIYALVVATPDRKMGSQLHPSTADCAGTPAACAPRIGPGIVSGASFTLPQLVNLLPRFVNRVVVDRTGLVGPFAIDLRWTPAPGEWMAPPLPGVSDPPADGPSLFTALQEQLGLRLESQRGPVDVLVVDSAERPTLD